jgi:hypothetical protein
VLQDARAKVEVDAPANTSDTANQLEQEELMRMLTTVQVRRLTG